MNSVKLAKATRAMTAWAEAHRKAAAAEARVLGDAMRYVRGQGDAPNDVQKEHAIILRREANALREALPSEDQGRGDGPRR